MTSTRHSSTSLLWLWVVITVAMLAVVISMVSSNRIQFNADVIDLLSSEDALQQTIDKALAINNRKALLMVAQPAVENAADNLHSLQQALQSQPFIEAVEVNPLDAIELSELIEVYGRFPLALLSQEGQQARDNNQYNYLIDNFFTTLSQPGNPMVSMTIEQSPLLTLADWFGQQQQGPWLQDGQLLYAEHQGTRYYPLFLTFSTEALQVDKVGQATDMIEQTLGDFANTTVLKSGFIFHHSSITKQARWEMQLFGGLSLAGVLLLTLFYFRTVAPLLHITLLIGSASLAGFTAVLLLFDSVHLLALVFAVSLIGICVDYGFHILLAERETRQNSPSLISRMLPALLVGGGTTLLSYLLLLVIPITFLHQVAAFVGAGIAMAVLTSLAIVCRYPMVSGSMPDKPGMSGSRRVYLGILFVCIGLCGWQFSRLTFVDDIRVFSSSPKAQIEQEIRISEIIGQQQYPRFIAVEGQDQDQVIQRMEQVRQQLQHHTDANVLGIDQWAPSRRQQQRNIEWVTKGLAEDKLASVTTYLTPQQIQRLTEQPGNYLSLEDIPSSLRSLYPAVIAQENTHIGLMSYAAELSPEQQADINAKLDFVIHYVDKPAALSAALSQIRQFVIQFLGMAAIAIVLLLSFRYGLRQGLILAAVPLLATCGGLAFSQMVEGAITVFNLLAGILILALSVDYAVFVKEQGRMQHVISANTLAAATSLLTFGMFVFSNTPAIAQFGLSVIFGVLIAYLLCLALPQSYMENDELVTVSR